MNALGYTVTRPFLEAALDAAFGFARMPAPIDEPRVHTVGPDPDRILLLGTAAVAGVGVSSHQLGLGGQLARRISSITGRGVDLEIEGSITLSLRDALAAVTGRPAGHHDAVVLFVGSRESIGLQPMRPWEEQLRELISAIVETDAASHVFVVATPPIERYATLPRNLADRVRGHVDRQNAASATICAAFPRATFLPLDQPAADISYQLGSAAYERWGDVLAPGIATRLDTNAHRVRDSASVVESARQAALDSLRVLDTVADERIDRIARTARDLLGASGASVTLLDHDRQWIRSAVSMSSDETARATSFCNTTIRKAELFVVEDAAADEAFAEHPWVVGKEQVRFYAGYPVEAPNGERVGALCVVDTKPRRFSNREAALLRELALRVQTLLWAG
jgi:hypothetical protein